MKTESEICRQKFWLLAAVLALLAVLLAFLLDASAASWINARAPALAKRSAVFISRIGDWPAHVALGLLGLGVAYLTQNKCWTRVFLAMLIACAVAGLAARIIKIASGRARPFVQTEAAWNGPRFSAKYNAFPSGHTASSTAFFMALFLSRKKIGAPFLLIPLLIAAARIFSGAHYLSDVTFAAALGIGSAILACRITLDHTTSQPLNPGCHQRGAS